MSRNQTELLDYTISNLQQNLSLGFVFICIVAVLFLGDVKSPFIIGLSMVVSIVISFLFFYLCKMSLNIISLSGLIGTGYDDRQFDYRNGKYIAIQGKGVFVAESLRGGNK